MRNLIVFVLFFAFIQGCATSYQNDGLTGGYSETQLDDNVFKVSFRGNAFTDAGKASDFTLLRSAEITLEQGSRYFVIIDANSYTTSSAHSTPTTSSTMASVSSVGGTSYGSATTTTYGGDSYIITKPNTSNTIIIFKEKPEQGFSYNAESVYKALAKKYGIESVEN